jgi:hypothetical protein
LHPTLQVSIAVISAASFFSIHIAPCKGGFHSDSGASFSLLPYLYRTFVANVKQRMQISADEKLHWMIAAQPHKLTLAFSENTELGLLA